MLYALERGFGNPSSLHAEGATAKKLVDTARLRVARLIGAESEEIIFTSGGTESDNLAIWGSLPETSPKKPALATSAIEHHAVLNSFKQLEREGCGVHYLKADETGQISLDRVEDIVRHGAHLISVMLANNEVGTIQPLAEISRLARNSGALVHSDAIQAAGKIPVDVRALGVDLLSVSAHKIYGPKGVGALYIRKGTRLRRVLHGGPQERGLRAGTENVPAIAGFGKACELAARTLDRESVELRRLRDLFEEELLREIPDAIIHARDAERLPNTSCASFPGADATRLAGTLDLWGLSVSTGSACTSSDRAPSHVLLAMGVPPESARAMLRFSFGRGQCEQDVHRAVACVSRAFAAVG